MLSRLTLIHHLPTLVSRSSRISASGEPDSPWVRAGINHEVIFQLPFFGKLRTSFRGWFALLYFSHGLRRNAPVIRGTPEARILRPSGALYTNALTGLESDAPTRLKLNRYTATLKIVSIVDADEERDSSKAAKSARSGNCENYMNR